MKAEMMPSTDATIMCRFLCPLSTWLSKLWMRWVLKKNLCVSSSHLADTTHFRKYPEIEDVFCCRFQTDSKKEAVMTTSIESFSLVVQNLSSKYLLESKP
jgi:hypothetical protein